MSPPEGLQCNVPQYSRDPPLKLEIQIKHLTNDHRSATDTATFFAWHATAETLFSSF